MLPGCISSERHKHQKQATTPPTETVAFGPVHNPWKAGHSAGGSSGGSGAAVAAGIVPVAHANDGGGSIRVPASCNGLVGLKPTRDRTPTGPDASDPLFAHAIEFVVTRSVRDSAALLDLVAGPDRGAPHIIAPPEQPFAEAATRPPGKLTIAYEPGSMLGTPVDAENAAAASNTAALLEELGHQVVESPVRVDFDEFAQHINVIWCAFNALFVEQTCAAFGCARDSDHFEAVTLTTAEFGAACTVTTLLAALDYVNRLTRETAAAFEKFDVLLSSTLASPPPAHGVLDQNNADLSPMDWTRQTFRYATNTPLANSTGQPAISLPLHWTADGLPVGVQFMGSMGQEGQLLSSPPASWRTHRIGVPDSSGFSSRNSAPSRVIASDLALWSASGWNRIPRQDFASPTPACGGEQFRSAT